jgi:hypothetical protein
MSRATYLYCLVRSGAPPPLLQDAPAGLPDCSPPRVLDMGQGLWLVVADAPLPDYDGETIQSRLQDLSWVSARALAHEAVVEHFLDSRPVIPMKLFTLFGNDERAAAYVAGERGRLERVLARLDGRVEWGVRVQLDEARAREVIAEEASTESAGLSAGKAFLLRKKVEQDGLRNLAQRLRAAADDAFTGLAAYASEALRRELPPVEAAGRVLLDAAFLVPRDEEKEFEAAVARAAGHLAGHAGELTLTGPWPPYHFVAETR